MTATTRSPKKKTAVTLNEPGQGAVAGCGGMSKCLCGARGSLPRLWGSRLRAEFSPCLVSTEEAPWPDITSDKRTLESLQLGFYNWSLNQTVYICLPATRIRCFFATLPCQWLDELPPKTPVVVVEEGLQWMATSTVPSFTPPGARSFRAPETPSRAETFFHN